MAWIDGSSGVVRENRAGVLVGVILSLVAAVSLGACGTSERERGGMLDEQPRVGVSADHFRLSMPDRGTLFDPLDLPTPSEVRLASGAPGPAYWQQEADYVIEVELDEPARRINGRATITYTNNSPHTLEHLWIHLEQNLYRAGSLGARASGDDFGLGGVPRDFEGGIELGLVSVDGEEIEARVYDTVARLDLLEPLGPGGESVDVEIAWTFEMPPQGSDRMGYEELSQGTVFLLAQWFPAMCKYDDVHGWSTLPYRSVGEFYTDFGDYEVAITVPRGHIVGATGVLMNEAEVLTGKQRERLEAARRSRETVMVLGPDEVGRPETRPMGEGALTWRFRAERVRTFAWASSPTFIWDAAAVDGDAPRADAPGGGGTLVMSLYPVEGMPLWGESTDMLRFAIEGYNNRWFTYPYPVAINVNGHVPGMEYPMIVFCAERKDEYELYSVTTHEIGHNWFPMLVNTDERRHAWMDEGFNSFINYYSELERYGKRMPYYDFERFLSRFQGDERQPMSTAPDRMWPRTLGWLAYEKPAWMLILLRERVMGPERFDDAFRAYIKRWAYKSPQPSDFFRTMEDVGGMDLSWFWRGWIYGTGTLDQAIGGVWIAPDDSEARITLVNQGYDAIDGVDSSGDGFDGLVMPVHLRVTFEGGGAGDFADLELPAEIWSMSTSWTTSVVLGGRKIVRIEIDPDGAMPDIDRENNVWRAGR